MKEYKLLKKRNNQEIQANQRIYLILLLTSNP